VSKIVQAGLEIFYQECLDLIGEIEESLLALEQSPHDEAAISNTFRHFHTIKGGASMFDLKGLSSFAHNVESLLSLIRNGKITVETELVTVLLESLDCIKLLVDQIETDVTPDETKIDKNLQDIENIIHSQSQETISSIPISQTDEPGTINSFLIRIKFKKDLLKEGLDPIPFFQEMSSLGKTIVIPHAHRIPSLEEIDPFELYIKWTIKLETEQSLEDIDDILMFYQLDHQVSIEQINTPPVETEEKAKINRGETLIVAKPPNSPKPKIMTPIANADNASNQPSTNKNPTIRVTINKLDRLVNLVGEALINQTRLTKIMEQVSTINDQLGETAPQLVDDNERIVRELQEQVLNIRMVPIQGTFAPFQRLVRSYSIDSGKIINLKVSGGETELDKTLTEKLSGPLKHLVRNAMDHGIEHTADRKQAGKDPEGCINISASQQEGHIIIEISDDGQGIDTEKVLQLAQKKGLVKNDEILTKQDIYQLLFRPGFSTAEQVSDMSGRGVGMDVVKRDIESLHGSIYVESQVGKGSMIRLRLPLTLAIIEGMLIGVEKETYTLPLLSVVESIKLYPGQIKTIKSQKEVAFYRDEYIPLIRLHSIFKVSTNEKKTREGLLIVIEHMGKNYALFADQILEQQQIVIKSLEDNFLQLPGIAGATILGDGTVSLIIDVSGLVKLSYLSDTIQQKEIDG
jgi:two-component system, chemotaxis family, sensor kinase CheA